MLKASIEKQDYHCLYFNAWATDFFNDPLVAFLGELVSNVPQSISGAKKFQGYIEKSKILATAIAKKALSIAGKFVTHGLLDLENIADQVRSEIKADALKNYVDAYEAEKSKIKKCKE